jgi:hypothetical protein
MPCATERGCSTEGEIGPRRYLADEARLSPVSFGALSWLVTHGAKRFRHTWHNFLE